VSSGGTGTVQPRPVELDGGIEIRPWFTPGFGDALSHRVAKHLGRARERIRIASPVLTAGPILGTLAEVVNEGRCRVVGVVDDTQVDDVVRQWGRNRVSAWKLPLLQAIVEKAGLAGKPSTPWSPDGVQDFMHAKVVVADDVSFVGSFNFSRSGERNAENVLEIHDPATADTLARYVEDVAGRYPRATLPEAQPDIVAGQEESRSAPNPLP
jgi:phosphatidylserine/phosphatidylglycerophosphate/cardiolipin synthase-like enzyme